MVAWFVGVWLVATAAILTVEQLALEPRTARQRKFGAWLCRHGMHLDPCACGRCHACGTLLRRR